MRLRTRNTHLSSLACGLAAVGALALSLVAPVATATPQPAPLAAPAPAGEPVSLAGAAASPPDGVSALVGVAAPAAQPATRPAGGGLSLRATSAAAAATVGAAQPDGEGGGYSCTSAIAWTIGAVGEDDHLEETVDVTFSGTTWCNRNLVSIDAIAGLYDRSAAFNGQTFDGSVIGVGPLVHRANAATSASAGAAGIRARNYNGGRKVEPAFEIWLQLPAGQYWSVCNPPPGERILFCSGLYTSTLHVVTGVGTMSTGLTKACRDQAAAVDAEMARVTVGLAGVPAATRLLRLVPAVKNAVTAFKKDLCGLTTAAAATTFAAQRGQQLWDTAVAQAKANVAQGDDRPLYWARLSMTRALHQWLPAFTIQRKLLKASLDQAARGMNSHDFTGATARKAFVSGFDPFQLDDAILGGNPSGAAVLKLDGTTVGGAEVQAVIFPVRYDDFKDQLVETVFSRHLSGPQQASVVTTVSQGGSAFDLEFYNGRRRSSDVPDNRDQQGGGSTATPLEPADMRGGAEFVATTLPVDRMRVGAPFAVRVNTAICELLRVGGPPLERGDGPTLGSLAVRGGGGGFLSNEIAYRVTRLRDELGSPVPAGHVHTPAVAPPSAVPDPAHDAARTSIVNQYRQILEAAVLAPPAPPIRVTTDRASYLVGQTPVYTVVGAPSSLVRWTGIRNGVSTGETDASYGHLTNAAGAWSGSYHAVTQPGTWVKYVRVDGRLAKVTFTVT